MKTQKEKIDEYNEFIDDLNKKATELRLKFLLLDRENQKKFLDEVKKGVPNATFATFLSSFLNN